MLTLTVDVDRETYSRLAQAAVDEELTLRETVKVAIRRGLGMPDPAESQPVERAS